MPQAGYVDTEYSAPIYMTGDMLAYVPTQPSNPPGVNPGQAGFGIVYENAAALGDPSELFRLAWTGNVNTAGVYEFNNGQIWTLQQYNPAADPDGDPYNDDAGWSTIPGYNNSLVPRDDLVSGLGAGDDYTTFAGANGGFLLYNYNGGLSETPSTFTYLAEDENGDPNLGDEDGRADFYGAYDNGPGPICFVNGTLLETANGFEKIENLIVGDLVKTRDHGYQPIRWIGSSKMSVPQMIVSNHLKPIRILAGALGDSKPERDLYVSPQHRMLVRSKIAERMFGVSEILIAAKHLLELEGVERVHDAIPVEYFHVMFDQHEIIYANGAEAESLLTGPQAMRSLSRAAIEEIRTLFPDLDQSGVDPDDSAVRTIANGRRGRQLVERHRKNRKNLQTA